MEILILCKIYAYLLDKYLVMDFLNIGANINNSGKPIAHATIKLDSHF
jgi:hypothetical protein